MVCGKPNIVTETETSTARIFELFKFKRGVSLLFLSSSELFLKIFPFLMSTDDSPQIGHAPDPGKPVALRTCPISGPHAIGVAAHAIGMAAHAIGMAAHAIGMAAHAIGMAAHTSPQKPVALRTCSH
jgi:hypothetical protein